MGCLPGGLVEKSGVEKAGDWCKKRWEVGGTRLCQERIIIAGGWVGPIDW
jgi:hypothetical protein